MELSCALVPEIRKIYSIKIKKKKKEEEGVDESNQGLKIIGKTEKR